MLFAAPEQLAAAAAVLVTSLWVASGGFAAAWADLAAAVYAGVLSEQVRRQRRGA